MAADASSRDDDASSRTLQCASPPPDFRGTAIVHPCSCSRSTRPVAEGAKTREKFVFPPFLRAINQTSLVDLGKPADGGLFLSFLSPSKTQGGTVVNGDASFRADVLVRGGKIAAVGLDIDPSSSSSSSFPWLPKFLFGSSSDDEKENIQNLKTVDCKDLLVLPGAIDPHTHLDAQMMGTTTADDFYTGTRAALAGGTTTIIDFALPRAGDGDLLAGLERYEKVAKVAACDYGFHVAVTNWSSRIEEQIGEVTRNR